MGVENLRPGDVTHKLIEVAQTDTSPSVISQLACTAQRLSAEHCIPIARAIAGRSEFHDDPYIPLLIWWAVERHAVTDVDRVLRAFASSDAWNMPLIRDVIQGRLMRRFAGDGSKTGFAACAKLLASAPDARLRTSSRQSGNAQTRKNTGSLC